MGAQEFLPGDRVRQHDRVGYVVACEYWGISVAFDSKSGSAPPALLFPEDLTLVSRPAYPEPGQRVVLLDEWEINAIGIAARRYSTLNDKPVADHLRNIEHRARKSHA